MATVVVDAGVLTVPRSINSIDAFRRWLDTDEVPEKARTWFIDGEVWIDMSKEQLDSHATVKGEIQRSIGNVVQEAGTGRVYPDGVLVTNTEAGWSGNPDMVYVSFPSQQSGRVKRVPGKKQGSVEIVGTPDVVLEVVSDSSERKDNQVVFDKYFRAGIPEYWLVDARGDEVEFTIYKRNGKRYTKVREHDGWVKSPVFDRSFRLVRFSDPLGDDNYRLEVK
jgi:Uma2 family endonuclease